MASRDNNLLNSCSQSRGSLNNCAIKGNKISKLFLSLTADRNPPDVLQKRVEYGNWFMGHAVRKSHCYL